MSWRATARPLVTPVPPVGERAYVELEWYDDVRAGALELEQWVIFVAWNRRYELGEASVESHPGHGGVDPRHDQVAALNGGP